MLTYAVEILDGIRLVLRHSLFHRQDHLRSANPLRSPLEIEFIGIGRRYYCFNDKRCHALRNIGLLFPLTQPPPIALCALINDFPILRVASRLRATFFLDDLLCISRTMPAHRIVDISRSFSIGTRAAVSPSVLVSRL